MFRMHSPFLKVLISLAISVCAIDSAAQGTQSPTQENATQEPFQARVQLNVEADAALATIVRGHLTTRLRNLNGVEVTDRNTDYQLDVVVLSGNNFVAMSAIGLWDIVLESEIEKSVEFLMSGYQVSEREGWRGLERTEQTLRFDLMTSLSFKIGKGHIGLHLLQTGSRGDLESMCADLVAAFDSEILEPRRKMHAVLEEQWLNIERHLEELRNRDQE